MTLHQAQQEQPQAPEWERKLGASVGQDSQ